MKILAFLLFLTLGAAQNLPTRLTDPVPSEVNLMYEQGLNYIFNSQLQNGAWEGEQTSHIAVTAFALMAVLAKGENINNPKVGAFISRCVESLLQEQDQETGYIGKSMYNHGFVTLVLSEAYGKIDDDRLGPALEKAIKLIVSSQKNNIKKAWRYTPKSNDADSTVTGCQLVALLGARNAGLMVPDEAITQGLAFIESCRTDEGLYGYADNSGGRPTLTAICVLCHYLAQNEVTEKLQKSVDLLKKRLNFRDQHYPFYYEYYMSQALFQADQKVWKDWNQRNIRYLKLVQNNDGSWNGNHGKVYSTSAALLSLALNYRYMPIYEKF